MWVHLHTRHVHQHAITENGTADLVEAQAVKGLATFLLPMLIRSCICVSVCFRTSWLACYVRVRAACVDFGCAHPLSITQQLSRGYLAVRVLLWNHHQSHLRTHADMWRTCFAVEERGEPRLQDAADRVQTSRGRARNTAGNICRSDLSEPSESVCWLRQDRRPFPVHTLQPRLLASLRESVCVTALPFLPPAEPPVPGMFHPPQRCFQDAHPEQ